MTDSRDYLDVDPNRGYPAGDDLFYECLTCGDVLSSLPPFAEACRCRNVVVDSDAGRMSVKDDSKLRLFRGLHRD